MPYGFIIFGDPGVPSNPHTAVDTLAMSSYVWLIGPNQKANKCDYNSYYKIDMNSYSPNNIYIYFLIRICIISCVYIYIHYIPYNDALVKYFDFHPINRRMIPTDKKWNAGSTASEYSKRYQPWSSVVGKCLIFFGLR